jgi:hypothetical protein
MFVSETDGKRKNQGSIPGGERSSYFCHFVYIESGSHSNGASAAGEKTTGNFG